MTLKRSYFSCNCER